MNRPWEPLGMTTALWANVPPQCVRVQDLVPTHGTKYPLGEHDTSYCGDPFPHVVMWNGCLYINDGHHRVARAIARGATDLLVRVLVPVVEV